ncbi:hypothetical protein [Kribbella speibonae]|uniref:N-terminal of MaoC-like dehydratase domain-containing protein n=1 Tax=Kribbella speibonae TaxID=1572660 RepID=A0A4R0IUL1_9ACTN|nr:hypothetical protein [Kribbella speibonae]TCC36460.1 hypothetical protein E0H92_27910 [Kribbella speibonae]
MNSPLADQLADHVGRTIRSPDVSVTPDMLGHFERGTLLDIAYVDDSDAGYESDMVPGFLTLSLIDALGVMTPELRVDGTYALNYGLDRVRFVEKVHIGDEVHAHFQTLSVHPRGGGFLVRRTATVERTSDDAVVAVMDLLLLLLPSSSGEQA